MVSATKHLQHSYGAVTHLDVLASVCWRMKNLANTLVYINSVMCTLCIS